MPLWILNYLWIQLKNLSLIKTEEELRDWVRNYARSIPEDERESFLEQMQARKSRSHKEILRELADWCEKIEEGGIPKTQGA